jgi:hypothetical protein
LWTLLPFGSQETDLKLVDDRIGGVAVMQGEDIDAVIENVAALVRRIAGIDAKVAEVVVGARIEGQLERLPFGRNPRF